uniref:Uncharacterized protein n=1 Tax=virus sp. ctkyY8 TaxID=2827995 RepID=A0A8S5RET4_9VIRU|nr:MAG TPA: hypothetical protein [virus sp. ctkyY8]
MTLCFKIGCRKVRRTSLLLEHNELGLYAKLC